MAAAPPADGGPGAGKSAVRAPDFPAAELIAAAPQTAARSPGSRSFAPDFPATEKRGRREIRHERPTRPRRGGDGDGARWRRGWSPVGVAIVCRWGGSDAYRFEAVAFRVDQVDAGGGDVEVHADEAQ
ncbi:hypothetical protein GCM10027184_44070 [Saccharothrix stipae]